MISQKLPKMIQKLKNGITIATKLQERQDRQERQRKYSNITDTIKRKSYGKRQ